MPAAPLIAAVTMRPPRIFLVDRDRKPSEPIKFPQRRHRFVATMVLNRPLIKTRCATPYTKSFWQMALLVCRPRPLKARIALKSHPFSLRPLGVDVVPFHLQEQSRRLAVCTMPAWRAIPEPIERGSHVRSNCSPRLLRSQSRGDRMLVTMARSR